MLILGGAMGAILNRLQQVATINEQYQNAIVSAQRLYEVLAAQPTVPEKPHAKPIPPGPGEVIFEAVTFGYAPDKPVLRNICFKARGGSIIAIVGPDRRGQEHAGQPDRAILRPASRPDPDRRRRSCAMSRSPASARRSRSSSRKRISSAIRSRRTSRMAGRESPRARSRLPRGSAQAHEFIEQLPKEYDTLLSERGSSLSGGQKQRLAIARAIVTNPRALILDDATAAIDPETEELIRRGMRFVMGGRTTFIIAHRISTVKRADLVIVLEQGRITQMGTHEELMNEDGHYREIAEVQLYADDDERRLRRAEHPVTHAACTSREHARRGQGPRRRAARATRRWGSDWPSG
jgi:ABC-type protease/lipase transport system fused ATPase/permease subunit